MYGGVLLRFNGENGATAVRYVQQIKGDEAMEKRGLFEPGRVFVQKRWRKNTRRRQRRMGRTRANRTPKPW